MKPTRIRCRTSLLLIAAIGAPSLSLAQQAPKAQPPAAARPAAAGDPKRGEYIVTTMGCGDCHTPFKMGQKGLEPDLSRLLSGHPEKLSMPAAPKVKSPWGGSVAETFTAWAGPWGVSFTMNLTPDPETGLGSWTQQEFVQTMRTGKHLGTGRQILRPMPWQAIGKMTDEDLRSVFAYLKTIPPIKNTPPNPRPPEVAAGTPAPATSLPKRP